MATLIGAGGHADDIYATLDNTWTRVPHHNKWKPDDPTIIGINNVQIRARVANQLGILDAVWIHPWTFIGPGCETGGGSHINYAVTMTRTSMGHHCTISPGVTICGDVTIGDRVFIGAGSTIKNLVTIGDDAFIRMGSVVTRDIAAGERY